MLVDGVVLLLLICIMCKPVIDEWDGGDRMSICIGVYTSTQTYRPLK